MALRLPRIFSDGCVLQTWDQGDARAFVYGDASPSTRVSVGLTSADPHAPFGRTFHALAGADGGWAVQLDGTYVADDGGRLGPHYGPYTLNVSSPTDAPLVVRDVWFGDVLICAGDEAMASPLRAERAPARTAPPDLRIARLTVGAARAATPARDVRTSGWRVGAAVDLGAFSALCWHAGLALSRLNPAGTGAGNTTGGKRMPVGLISAAARASALSEWAPRSAAAACAPSASASSRYNGMAAPLSRLAVRAVVWAHGASDARRGARADTYGRCLRALIARWRDAGPTGDYAWAMAQLGVVKGVRPASADTAAALRLAQASALPAPLDAMADAVDASTLAPSYDLLGPFGNASELGRRVALGIAHAAYGKQEPAVGWAPPHLVAATAGRSGAGAVDVELCVAVGADAGPLALVSVIGGGCRSAGEGPLVQGEWPELRPAWRDATSITPSSRPCDGGGARAVAVHVGFRGAETPPVRLRIGLARAETPPACFLINGNGLPAMPADVAVAATESLSATHATPRRAPRAAVPRPTPPAPQPMLPPLGFNSWNRWHCNVDEQLIVRTAELMVSLGLVSAGYTYLNIDDCWQANLHPDPNPNPHPVT